MAKKQNAKPAKAPKQTKSAKKSAKAKPKLRAPAPKREDVKVRACTAQHDGPLKVVKLDFDAPRFAGGRMQSSREVLMRADAASCLVHDIERDVIILCEQFRAPVYQGGKGAWLVELPAGKLDGDESAKDCMHRELIEEIGYRARSLDPIGVYYPAPGYSTERLHLFYAAVTKADLIEADAHGVDEGEDVRRIETPVKTFLERLRLGKYEDGKIMAAGAWALSTLA